MRSVKCVALVLALAVLFTAVPAYAAPDRHTADGDDWDEMDCTKKVPFSPEVKQRLDAVIHKIHMDYIELIETYYWAGALTEQQKNTRLIMLKNYVETFKKRNYRWCSEHEVDEWEEEWFNSDE